MLTIIVIGDGAVGKTSLIKKYTKGSFAKDYIKTIGAQFSKYDEDIEGNNIKLFFCLIFLFTASDANAQYEISTAYETNWGDDGYYSCGNSNYDNEDWEDIAFAFRDTLEDNYPYSDTYSTTYSELKSSRFSDPNYYTNAVDYDYFDDADIGFLLTHGGLNSSDEFGAMASNWWYSGSPVNYCNSAQEDMYYGDNYGVHKGDMEHFIFAGCNGLHYCTCWKWNFTFQLHGIHAFHGSTAINIYDTDRFVNFVNDGFDESVSDSWISHMRWNNGAYSFCPVTVTAADTIAHAQDYMFDEEFYPLMGDYPPFTHKVRRKYSSCDPGYPGSSSGYNFYDTVCN